MHMHDFGACVWIVQSMFMWLTEQRTYEDENLNGGGEVPVGLLSDEALLLVQPGPLRRRAAVPPGRRARGVQEIQPEVGCCEIGCAVPDRRSPAPTSHVGSPPRSWRFIYLKKAGGMSAASAGEAFLNCCVLLDDDDDSLPKKRAKKEKI